jgi:hypothetical protein
MKNLFFFIFLFVVTSTLAQYRVDYGVKLGVANYLGDIGGKELTRRDFIWDMHLPQSRFAVGAFARYKRSKRFAYAVNMDYLRIQDADRYTTNPARRSRNMNFRNNMIELGLRGELTIWYDNDVGNRGYYNPDFKMYLFGGVAGYYSNPMGQIYDSLGVVQPGWIKLRDLRTEGQSQPYSQIGFSVPVGLGMYFTFNKKWRIGWELGWRTTFTDYLDDISTTYAKPDTKLEAQWVNQTYQNIVDAAYGKSPTQPAINNFRYDETAKKQAKRGDPTHNDAYLTSQITISRVLRGRSQFYRSKYSWLKNRAGVRRSRAKF